MTTNLLQQSLKSLLPSTTTTIPPRLLRAADSLLSLSRQKAANLKPDEEIARVHACAEIACKRLRAQLRLPNIKSGNGAPCRPAIYKRLVAFLEGILRDAELLGTPQKLKDVPNTPTTTGRSSGRKRRIESVLDADDTDDVVETPTKKRRNVDVSTPNTLTKSTTKKINGFLGKIQASASKSKGKQAGNGEPSYILPAVRDLCRAFKTNKMIVHVYTGVCVIIKHNAEATGTTPTEHTDEDSRDEADNSHVKFRHLCLVLAVFAVSLTRMHEGEITQEVFDIVSDRGLPTIEEADSTYDSTATKATVEDWIGKITTWTTKHGPVADWIDSVPLDALGPFKMPKTLPSKNNSLRSAVVLPEPDHSDIETEVIRSTRRRKAHSSRQEEIRRELEKDDPDDVLLPGLGTMMTHELDYFSAERDAEYEEWEADILRRIELIEKGPVSKGKKSAAVIG